VLVLWGAASPAQLIEVFGALPPRTDPRQDGSRRPADLTRLALREEITRARGR
jgi:hypothetical protein